MLENILNKCHSDTENLMVVGFIETLQNICGWDKVDYHKEFDEWLQPTTKKNWDLVIHWWESVEAKQKWKEYQQQKNENAE